MKALQIQQAIFEYLSDASVSIFAAAVVQDLNTSTLHRIVSRWARENPGAQPKSPYEIVVSPCATGLPRVFSSEEEDLMAELILSYANNGTPLTIQLVQQVAKNYFRRTDRMNACPSSEMGCGVAAG